MKIGIFTDSHYSSQEVTCGNRYNSKSLEKIKEAYRFFESQKCDLILCLGDLIDKETSHEKEVENLKEIADVINRCPIKTICVMGNHDAFAFTESEFYAILPGCKPETIQKNNITLLFLDTCYFKNGSHYQPGDSDWTDTYYPHIESLQQTLNECCGSVYVFLHQNLDPSIRSDHRVHNAEAINALLQKCGKVTAVYQGHYHPGETSMHNGIRYVAFPAMCEQDNACFIEEI